MTPLLTLSLTSLAAAACLVFGTDIAAAQHSLRESTDHYLLLHSGRIASSENVTLVPGAPVKHGGNPIMVEDRPWEVRSGNLYPNILFDPFEKFYKGWFSPFFVGDGAAQALADRRGGGDDPDSHAGTAREAAVLYGTSHDGQLWNKPLLDLNPWVDGARTNILVRGPFGAGILRDPRDPRALYKMIHAGAESLETRTSADGIRWSGATAAAGPAVPQDGATQTHPFVFWASERREYVVMTQLLQGTGAARVRVVGRTASKDFRAWTAIEPVFKGQTPGQQIVSLPVLAYGGVYLGFPGIHDLEQDRVHTELAWSPDTIRWERISPGTPFVGNGAPGSGDWGCAITGSVIPMNDGVRIFYGASDGAASGSRKGTLNLARLDSDRFAGYRAEAGTTGVIHLKPLPYRGGSLHITADVDDGAQGYVLVSAEDKDGNNVIPSTRIERSGTDIPVGAVIPQQSGELALRIRLQGATVFSVGFR